MTQWTSQQLKCLEAIGVPVYAYTPATSPQASADAATTPLAPAAQTPLSQASEETTAIASEPLATKQSNAKKIAAEGAAPAAELQAGKEDKAQANTSADKPHYYQLGPWVFEFSRSLPVESFDWLRDLAAYCKSTPTQVSHTEKPVHLSKYARNQLSPADKKDLWELLKANR